MNYFNIRSKFNDDISQWNVSNVTDMEGMFQCDLFGQSPSFNGDISGWDVSSVTNMEWMFIGTPFNGDISGWDVSSVTNLGGMFDNCLIPEDKIASKE
jgi:surface protein